MTAFRIAMFFCLLACAAADASAVALELPTLYHHPATGNLWLTNPLGPPASRPDGPIIYFQSASNSLIKPVTNPIPGSIYDPDEFPVANLFYNVPIGSFDLGQLVLPGVPTSDLSLKFFAFLVPPFTPEPGLVVTIPEPSTIAIGCLAVVGVAALRRRK
jgi:hypothetical protein